MTEEQDQTQDEEPKSDREEGGPTADESEGTPEEGAKGTKETPGGLDAHE